MSYRAPENKLLVEVQGRPIRYEGSVEILVNAGLIPELQKKIQFERSNVLISYRFKPNFDVYETIVPMDTRLQPPDMPAFPLRLWIVGDRIDLKISNMSIPKGFNTGKDGLFYDQRGSGICGEFVVRSLLNKMPRPEDKEIRRKMEEEERRDIERAQNLLQENVSYVHEVLARLQHI